MSDTVIKVENLSKQYRLGLVGTGTLSHDLNRWWHRVRGKEDPYLKIGETNVRESKGDSHYVWALKDINFDVKQGEVLGIIGKNGAGKSTLLKILSKVTGPTTGSIKAKGRIASLLEVGTGFHPELTGRENIYLNGAILGMTKAEVRNKLDEIVDFAGVARYVDTPVKRYSSGMMVRLGFAVAAHLEPEILIVDEVLAVGDAEFQKKAVGKMQDVSHNKGRTVIFVSHNMQSVDTLCQTCILLENGTMKSYGEVKAITSMYLEMVKLENKRLKLADKKRRGSGAVRLTDFWMENSKGEKTEIIYSGEETAFVFQLKKRERSGKCQISCGFSIHTEREILVARLYSHYDDNRIEIKQDSMILKFYAPSLNLAPGRYLIAVRILVNGEEADWPQGYVGTFNVNIGSFYDNPIFRLREYGPMLLKGYWEYNTANIADEA